MRTNSIFDVPAPPEPPVPAPAEPARADALFRDAAPSYAAVHAADHFRAAARAPDAMPDTVIGLRTIAIATASGELGGCPVAELQDLCAAIGAAMDPVIASAADRIPGEAVALGLAAASGLVATHWRQAGDREPIVLNDDRLDHLCLLADELDALVRRRRIEARGDVLRRVVRINYARAAGPDGATRH